MVQYKRTSSTNQGLILLQGRYLGWTSRLLHKGLYMTTTRCETCVGRRTIIGLGGLVKECPTCKGVGHVKVEEKQQDRRDKR